MERPRPTGREISFGEDEIIVSKTDTRGVITYSNTVFQRVSGYTEEELQGKPHSVIRHPDMPRCVFRLLWDTVQSGHELFAYVLNLAKSGDGYWVFAHITPSFGPDGKIIGYHSNRRVPARDALEKVRALYGRMLSEEKKHGDKESQIKAGEAVLASLLSEAGMSYGEFVFGLSRATRLEASIR